MNVLYQLKLGAEHSVSTYGCNEQEVLGRQFRMTAAYAFTDNRSQGQTIPYVEEDSRLDKLKAATKA